MIRTKLVLFFILLLALPTAAFAQSAEYRLDPRRNFGYGAGSDVRGDFTNRVSGPQENIASVTYFVDGQKMAEVTAAPFEYRYNTNQYAPGWHEMYAVVVTKDGREVTTPVVQLNFLSAEQQAESFRKIIIPLAAGILLVTLLGVSIQFLVVRRDGKRLEPGAPRNYGLRGGTICSRCGRAYPIHIWAVNLGLWRLDRCDFCGKVALVTRRSPQELAAAEQAEREALRGAESSIPGVEAESEQERMKKLLDESRYQ